MKIIYYYQDSIPLDHIRDDPKLVDVINVGIFQFKRKGYHFDMCAINGSGLSGLSGLSRLSETSKPSDLSGLSGSSKPSGSSKASGSFKPPGPSGSYEPSGSSKSSGLSEPCGLFESSKSSESSGLFKPSESSKSSEPCGLFESSKPSELPRSSEPSGLFKPSGSSESSELSGSFEPSEQQKHDMENLNSKAIDIKPFTTISSAAESCAQKVESLIQKLDSITEPLTQIMGKHIDSLSKKLDDIVKDNLLINPIIHHVSPITDQISKTVNCITESIEQQVETMTTLFTEYSPPNVVEENAEFKILPHKRRQIGIEMLEDQRTCRDKSLRGCAVISLQSASVRRPVLDEILDRGLLIDYCDDKCITVSDKWENLSSISKISGVKSITFKQNSPDLRYANADIDRVEHHDIFPDNKNKAQGIELLFNDYHLNNPVTEFMWNETRDVGNMGIDIFLVLGGDHTYDLLFQDFDTCYPELLSLIKEKYWITGIDLQLSGWVTYENVTAFIRLLKKDLGISFKISLNVPSYALQTEHERLSHFPYDTLYDRHIDTLISWYNVTTWNYNPKIFDRMVNNGYGASHISYTLNPVFHDEVNFKEVIQAIRRIKAKYPTICGVGVLEYSKAPPGPTPIRWAELMFYLVK